MKPLQMLPCLISLLLITSPSPTETLATTPITVSNLIPQQSETDSKQETESTSPPATDDQQNDQDQEPTPLEVYRQKKKRFREVDREIGVAYGSLPVGLPEEQQKQVEKIEALKAEKSQLQLGIFEAAVVAFRESEEVDRNVTRDLLAYASACLSGNQYEFPVKPDTTIEICQMIVDKGVKASGVYLLGFEAGMHQSDLETAKFYLDKLSEMNDKRVGRLLEEFDAMTEIFQLESELHKSEKDLPRVELSTSLGNIVIELFENQAPDTVGNFISLVDQGFYNGKSFFRVNRGKFSMTGCPKNVGTGTAGYKVHGEANAENARKHLTGTVSMVPMDADLNCGSQFIIAQSPIRDFDGKFTVIGRVIEGMDVVTQMPGVVTKPNEPEPETIKIDSAKVLYRRPNSNYVPKKVEQNRQIDQN